MKAVAYLRVSTQDQSLVRQREDIKKFASDKKLNLVEIFEDKISGSKTNTEQRDGFIEMENFIEQNQDIKHILILELSRLGRKNNDIQNVVEKYIQKGINIFIDDLDIQTIKNGKRSFESEIIISMLGVMAANETRLLSSRISSGKMSRARKNLAFGGKIIGYKKGEEGTPVIDKSQAPIVKRIFELTSQGLGMRNVSAIIESEFNKRIPIGTLGGIVRNSFHKGERKYNGLSLIVPNIVSDELWQKANDSIDSRKKFGSRATVHTNIIHGKITCGECNNVMHQKVISKARLNLFVCKNDDCRNSINRPWLFRMIRLVVEKHAKKTKDKQVRKKVKLDILSYISRAEINKKEIEKLNRRRIKAQSLWMDEQLTDGDYRQHIDEILKSTEKFKVDNNILTDNIKSLQKYLESNIEHFSKEIEAFKIEIQDIIREVIIHKDRVLINIFGWRVYDLNKPNSTLLGWQARKVAKGIEIIEELPLRHNIDDENLDMMINNELNNNEGEIDDSNYQYN